MTMKHLGIRPLSSIPKRADRFNPKRIGKTVVAEAIQYDVVDVNVSMNKQRIRELSKMDFTLCADDL